MNELMFNKSSLKKINISQHTFILRPWNKTYNIVYKYLKIAHSASLSHIKNGLYAYTPFRYYGNETGIRVGYIQ